MVALVVAVAIALTNAVGFTAAIANPASMTAGLAVVSGGSLMTLPRPQTPISKQRLPRRKRRQRNRRRFCSTNIPRLKRQLLLRGKHIIRRRPIPRITHQSKNHIIDLKPWPGWIPMIRTGRANHRPADIVQWDLWH